MSMGNPVLNWDVSPKNGLDVFFSQEKYEEYSLTPTLKELLILSKRPIGENLDASANPVENEPAVNSAAQANGDVKTTIEIVPFPEPRIPYPYFSRFSEREQKCYVDLHNKYSKKPINFKTVGLNKKEYFQYMDMKKCVNDEVAEFLKFLQNAAKSCSQDYDILSDEALLFTKQFLSASIEQVKKYPEIYSLHEITSLMGFLPTRTEMGLKLEKTVLALGNVKFAKLSFPLMPAELPLSIDYKSTSTIDTPEQKAAAIHYDISTDPNAEKLVLRYHPQIALTSRSLFTLLNNHAPNYKEQWEIPVCVKIIPITGSKSMKIIYIDSPLPKKEMTVRERNQIFHEVPLDLLTTKTSAIPVSAVFMDKPEENIFQWDVPSDIKQCRRIETFDDLDLSFDEDVTELETFGVTANTPLKTSNTSSLSTSSTVTNLTTTSSTATVPSNPISLSKILMEQLKKEKELVTSVNSGPEEQKIKDNQELSLCDNVLDAKKAQLYLSGNESKQSECDSSSSKDFEKEKSELSEENDTTSDEECGTNKLKVLEKTNTFKEKIDISEASNVQSASCNSDTDEERLIIDIECKNHDNTKQEIPVLNSSPVLDTLRSPGPIQISSENITDAPCSHEQKKCTIKKSGKRLYKKFDPVGQILKMQNELLKPTSKKVPEQAFLNLENSKPPPIVLAPEQPGTSTDTLKSKCSLFQKPKGRLLPHSLQMFVENKSEYLTPQEGNLVYKLFNFQDLLLLVRCGIQKVETRPRSKKRKNVRRQSPVYILPKLEYQACYGVEALTESELCRLWTESLLHSNCLFYIGHIDAFTSKLFMLEEIPMDVLKEKFATLNTPNAFNVLQHILKKISSLQEGSYLLSHAAEDSSLLIYKNSDEKFSRTAYNLHKAHCTLPTIPSSLSVPWVPLDPTVLLPYHIHHGRIPCTFPPKSQGSTKLQKVGGTRVPVPGHRNPITAETKNSSLPAQQSENEGVVPKKRKQNSHKKSI
ncbi:little elongation complex subunit 2 [Sarcophilus harrisii]|uniref:Interactor of little elongation complex ELL subunit 2 n=1 Tax=Sarcophilus harrisii TaxID=9305 RepID=G3WS19_SARHA|nr:little elongation complex subunit 2 [Sarcophilus harrisii]XP_012398462.1 little elongation complex subunit 2 [Sarcophilus harrisii]XP_023353433.1 little elongation complex subunit 2 [Sarcophilus harrisii]XP_023353437.1 little elongation complex subunit 2 [Sarcophilus harrisii]XP_031811308.1 little elongation complex subunit 2 [Sarcophilus harrisii]XP_031811309.1 little elongation complex subunit 2 [Sarcophilus harrisii]XP_031811310.1 little elongation complex subunit 2 [Sarcophilus harrisi